jgi:cell division protein FtsN
MARPPENDDMQLDGRRVVDLSPAEEDWDEPKRERKSGGAGKAVLLLGAAVLLVGAGMGAGWLFYSNKAGTGAGAPLVRAPQEDIKVRPDEPGGMDVPDTDKGVYDVVSGNAGEPKTEKLLDAPERPQVPEDSPAAAEGPLDITKQPAPPSEPISAPPPVVAKAPEPVSDPATESPAPSPAPIGNVASEPVAAPPAAPQEEARAPEPKPEPPKPAEPVQLVKAKPAAEAPGTDSWRVQVGALRDEDTARKEFARLQKVHPDLLGSLGLSIMKVDITGKGTFYRMRAGPLDNRAAAASLCEGLKAKKVPCLLVRPGK